jgi:hypothetical protein
MKKRNIFNIILDGREVGSLDIDNLGKHHNLGRFDNEEDAYSAHCEAAKKMHKNFFHA